MFVSIDMDALRFLHKHHDHETLSALSWLECGQTVSIRIEHTGDRNRFLSQVSDLDVRMLYKNSTGSTLPMSDATAIRHQLADMVTLMGATRAIPHEVLAQVAAVEDRLYAGERFKYVVGAKVPAQPQELFPLRARPLTERELADAHARSRVPVTTYPPRLSGQPLKPWEQAPADVPAVPAAPQTPPPPPVAAPTLEVRKARAGGVKPVVFGTATAAMEAMGSTAFFADWTAQRQKLIDKLVGDGYHQTTVRIKLSEWAKQHGI